MGVDNWRTFGSWTRISFAYPCRNKLEIWLCSYLCTKGFDAFFIQNLAVLDCLYPIFNVFSWTIDGIHGQSYRRSLQVGISSDRARRPRDVGKKGIKQNDLTKEISVKKRQYKVQKQRYFTVFQNSITTVILCFSEKSFSDEIQSYSVEKVSVFVKIISYGF